MSARAWGLMGAVGLGTAIAYGFVNAQSKANVKRFEESSTALPHEKDWVRKTQTQTLLGGGPTSLAKLKKVTDEKRRKIAQEYEKHQNEEYERKLKEENAK